jgi:transposase
VRYFAKAKGQRAKTDPIDARIIAEFTTLLVDTPPVAPDRAREELAGLVRTRRVLVDKRADLVKAVSAAPEVARSAVQSAIETLAQAIAELDETIDHHVQASPATRQTVKRLLTAPGIGPVVAVSLAALAPELGRLSGGQIAALAGVAPFPDDSGERSGLRHIAGGRADLRRVLYMAAMVAATRGKGVLAAFYQRLIKAGKPPKVALTACMRKLLVRVNAMLAHGQDWNEQPA